MQHIVTIRAKTGLNQSEFWGKLGVTQSGGSRYENGRSIPSPVQTLITIAFGTEREAQSVFKKLRNGK